MAPFTPFFAEWLYQQVGVKYSSVHLEEWPTAGEVAVDVLNQMAAARAVVTDGLAQRMAAGLKVRQPLAAVTGPQLGADLEAIVKDELNVLEYRFGEAVKLDTTLTDALKISGQARELVRAINALRKAAGLTVHDAIAVTYAGSLEAVIARHRQEILTKTNAKTITSGAGGAAVTINGQPIKLAIKKISH
jgi:isoleucyl-tRNA synthetase